MRKTGKTKIERPRRRIDFKGICADARELGRNRTYLWKVLTGRLESRVLMARYDELKASQAN